MSGQLRTLKNRIRSVESTKKITRAMEMVAAAKLRRFQDMMVKARPYTEGLAKLLERVGGAGTHPFLESREEKRAALVLFTSDTGLCGSYNNELVERARRFLVEKKNGTPVISTTEGRRNPEISRLRLEMTESPFFLIGVGKFGINALKRAGFNFHSTFTDIRASRVEEILAELKEVLEKIFLEREVDSVYVVYSHFLTVTQYQGATEKLLPLESPDSPTLTLPLQDEGGGKGRGDDYIFEPSPEIIFNKLIPAYFEAKTRMIFLESFVSEQIARMRAMHQATENAREMIDSLVLARNKARQAAITKELIEVVSGSRALKIK